MLTTIYLHGRAGKLFGTIFKLDVERVSEAIRALCYLKPGFRDYIRECADKGVGFRVSTEAGVLNEDQLWLPATKEIHIRPIVMGSKRSGIFQTILAVVLIVAAFYIAPGVGIKAGMQAFAAGKATFAATFVMSAGVSMLVGGISTLIANPNGEGYAEGDDKRSYLFSGPVRSTTQGIALPIGYGRLFVSGIPVSTDLVNGPVNYPDNYGTGDYSGNEPYAGGSPTNPNGGVNPDLKYWGWVPEDGVGSPNPGTPGNPYLPPVNPPVLPDIDNSV